MPDENRIGQLFGHPRDSKSYLESEALVLPKTHIGVEVEIEGMNKISNALQSNKRFHKGLGLWRDEHSKWKYGSGFWFVKTDGSLRDYGVEFVTDKLFGHDLICALDELSDLLKNTKHNISDRCGIHIHIDVRDLSPEEYERFVLDYIIFERILFRYCGVNRQENLYCMPFCKSDSFKHIMSDISHCIKTKQKFITFVSNFERYSALNLSATSKYGSLEFRQLPTTNDMSRVLEWINIIMCLKKNSYNNNSNNLHKEISRHGFSNYLEHIFGEYSDSLTNKCPQSDNYILEGIRLVQEIINYNDLASNRREYFVKNNIIGDKKFKEEFIVPEYFKNFLEENDYSISKEELEAEIIRFKSNFKMNRVSEILRQLSEDEEEENWNEEEPFNDDEEDFYEEEY